MYELSRAAVGMIRSEACIFMQAMTDAADKVADKAVPMTEKAAEMIEEKAAQVCTSTLLEERTY